MKCVITCAAFFLVVQMPGPPLFGQAVTTPAVDPAPAFRATPSAGRTRPPRVATQVDQARAFQGTPRSQTRNVVGGPQSAREGGTVSDMGEQWILKRDEKAALFDVFADVSAFYTDNAALARTNRESDTFLVGQAGISNETPLGADFTLDAGLRASFFRYRDLSILDFDSLDASAGLTWAAERLWDLDFFVGYNFNRLTTRGFGDEIYLNHALNVGVEKTIAFSDAIAVSFGPFAQVNFSDPDELSNNEFGIFARFNVSLTEQLSVDLLYRLALLDYRTVDRRDVTQNISVGLHYDITDWLSANLFSSAGFNNSDLETFDYRAINAGGGVSISFRF